MPSLHQLLPRIWQRRGAWAWLLRPLSWVYGALWALRQLAYRRGWLTSGHPGAFVIVVGNVVAGGAGKTPTTVSLVQHLQSMGLRVGVVSRGHGRSAHDIREVQADSSPAQVGDEPLLIHRHTQATVWVGAARLQTARQLLQTHPDTQVIVCDDGLQHLALQRDLEICLMDDRGTGNGWMLPAGPPARALATPCGFAALHPRSENDRRRVCRSAPTGRSRRQWSGPPLHAGVFAWPAC